MASATMIRWQDQDVINKDGKWTVDGRPTVSRRLVAQYSPSNVPDHYYIGLEVTAPVHGGAALTATMVRGKMLNQTVCPHHDPDSQGDGGAVYGPGDTWYEPPGCHHVRSENVGDEEAVFLAWFVISKEKVDAEGWGCLVLLDADVEEKRGQV